MQSTLARPGPARPITVLLVLLALDAGGARAQGSTIATSIGRWDPIDCYDSDCVGDRCPGSRSSCSTSEYSSSRTPCSCGVQPAADKIGQCCDPNAGSSSGPPTIVTCTDYPEGRVGYLWNGKVVCLSHKQGGSPKTAAGCAGLSSGDTCLPFAPNGRAGSGSDGGTCRERLSTSGSACDPSDSCYEYPYLACMGSVANAATCSDDSAFIDTENIPDFCSCVDTGFSSSGCQDGSFCCSIDDGGDNDGFGSMATFCQPGALFPGEGECQDVGGLIGFIFGICCGVGCLVGGLVYLTSLGKCGGAQQQQAGPNVYLPPGQKQPGAYYGESEGGLAAAAF